MTLETAPRHSHRVASSRASVAPKAVPALSAAAAATAITHFVPLLGPLLLALLFGALVANTRLAEAQILRGHAAVTKFLLRVGVVLIGLKLPVSDILGIGVRGLVVIIATVSVTFFATRFVGGRMGLDHGFVTLLAAGFSICGAAAIAAVSDAVKARERDVAIAVAMVTLFGSGMLIALPMLSAAFGLNQEQSAIWAGASIHEVAQVVAAASIIGSGALAVATTVKLGRVALLAPIYMLVARGSSQEDHSIPLVPWFLWGFMGMVAIRSSGWLPAAVVPPANQVTTILLAAGMFGLGLGFRVRDLWPFPMRALLLACVSTAIAGGSSLVLIIGLYS